MKKCLMMMLSMLTAAAFADEWVWIGGASGTADNAPWSFRNNWTNSLTGARGFPNSENDIAVFDGDATLRCAWDPTGKDNSHKLGGIKVMSGTVEIFSFQNGTRPIEFAGATNVIEIAEGATLRLTNGPSICGTDDGVQVVVLTGLGTFIWSGNSRIGALQGTHRLKDFLVKDFCGGNFTIPSTCGSDAIYTLHLASGMTTQMPANKDNLINNTCTIRLDAGATFDMNGRQDVVGAIEGEGEIVNLGRLQMTLPSAYGPYAFGGRFVGTLEVNSSGSNDWGANSYILLSSPTAFADTNFKPCDYNGGSFLRYAAGIESFTVKNYAPASGQPVPLKDVAENRVNLTMGVCSFNEYNLPVSRYTLDLSSAGGTITALAASTEAAPLVSGLDFADTTQMIVAIDTKSYATYIDQTFGANTTVEKYGAATLYALADSTHAKTSIEEGTVERLGPQQQFGLVWDAPDGESSDLVWKGASGASWAAAASWNPEQSPTRNDNLTVNGAASVALPDGRVRAKTLALAGSGTAELSGNSELFVSETLSFSAGLGDDNYGLPKVVSVASGSDVKIRTAKQEVKDMGFVKAGAGDLSITYSQGGSVAFADNLNPTTIQHVGNTKPNNWFDPLTSIPSGDAAPGWNALGPMNVLEGRMKITGVGSGFAGNALANNETVTYISTFGRNFDETPYGGWDIIGSAYPADAAELVLGNLNAVLGQLPNNNKPIVGAFTANNGPTHPALRLENNFCGIGDLLLGVGLKKAVYPEFTMTNATLRVYNFVRFGGWDYTKQFLNKGYYTEDPTLYNPVVRLGAGADLRHQLGGNAAAYVTLGGRCDVRVEDGAKVRMERHNANNPNVGGFVRTDSWATGFMRFSRGALLTFVNGVFCNNYDTATSASENFTFQFDGGIFRPVKDDGSNEPVRFPYLFVAHPEHQGVVVMDGGMEANITTGFTYTFAAPMRGEGAVRKTGAGTLVIAKGRKPGADDTRLIFNPEDYANLPLSGVTTLQNAGGLVWEEGGLEIESGALDTCSRLKLCGQTLDFQNQTDIRCGVISGRGTVANASFAALVLAPVADDADTPLFDGVAFTGLPIVDFMASAEAPATLGRAVRVARVANAQGLPNSFLTKASNTGLDGIRSARCTVDSEGWVWAAPAQTGFYISIH